jgi:rubrerythrin
MGLRLSSDEALEIAQRMEQNGARFYRRAAELKALEKEKEVLLKLAEMEDCHEKYFRMMQDELPEEERSKKALDPFGEMLTYLEAMADMSGGEGSLKAFESLTGDESLPTVLTTAIGLEKESILYYIGLKDMVPSESAKRKIDEIIREEGGHIVTLKKELDSL